MLTTELDAPPTLRARVVEGEVVHGELARDCIVVAAADVDHRPQRVAPTRAGGRCPLRAVHEQPQRVRRSANPGSVPFRLEVDPAAVEPADIYSPQAGAHAPRLDAACRGAHSGRE